MSTFKPYTKFCTICGKFSVFNEDELSYVDGKMSCRHCPAGYEGVTKAVENLSEGQGLTTQILQDVVARLDVQRKIIEALANKVEKLEQIIETWTGD